MASARALALLLLTAGALAGCGGPDPTQLRLTVAASDQLNPNSENQPSPAVLRLYELKTADAFRTASFSDLYENDAAKLGGDLLGRREMFIEPGKTVEVSDTLPPQTAFLGVLVAFRTLDSATWRLVLPVEAEEKNRFRLAVDARAVGQPPKPSGFFFGLF